VAIAELFAAVAVTDFDAMQAWNERLMGITFGRPRAETTTGRPASAKPPDVRRLHVRQI